MPIEVPVVCAILAFTGWVYLRIGRWFFERRYGPDPDLLPEWRNVRAKPAWYWANMRSSGGMPVEYTAIDGSTYRALQTGIWGVQIGTIFVGVVRGHRDPGHDRK